MTGMRFQKAWVVFTSHRMLENSLKQGGTTWTCLITNLVFSYFPLQKKKGFAVNEYNPDAAQSIFRAVVNTPKIIATTVKPCAKIRPLIRSWDCRVLPCLKARRPYINAPAVPRQPIGTNGFSFDFLINFSWKVSSLGRDRGVNPSITGGLDKSSIGKWVVDADCSGTTGVVAAAMSAECLFTELRFLQREAVLPTPLSKESSYCLS